MVSVRLSKRVEVGLLCTMHVHILSFHWSQQNSPLLQSISSLWVFHTWSASDWCALQEARFQCMHIDTCTIRYKTCSVAFLLGIRIFPPDHYLRDISFPDIPPGHFSPMAFPIEHLISYALSRLRESSFYLNSALLSLIRKPSIILWKIVFFNLAL